MKNNKITKYQIINHGIDSSSYFQVCGIACTEYDDVATGTGETAHEAFKDAAEQLAQGEWDVEGIPNDLDDEITKCDGCEYQQDSCEGDAEDQEYCADCEKHFFVSIRVKGD